MKKNPKVNDIDFSQMKKVESDHRKYVKKGFYMSYSVRIGLMLAIALLMGIISYNCFNYSFTEGEETHLMYEEKGELASVLTLLPDNPYINDELQPNDQYISDAINNIITNFQYNISYSELVDLNYSYYVVAETDIINKDNGNVLSHSEDILIPVTEKKVKNTSVLNIMENVKLDYKAYNDIAKSILEQNEVDAEGNITLKMNINATIDYEDFESLVKEQELKTTIPLLSQEVKLNNSKDIDNKDMYSKKSASKLTNKNILYVGIALLIVDVIFILLICSFILKSRPKKSKYCILRDGLLKDYDDIIVNSRNIPKFTGSNLIDCYNFQELLDAQRVLKKPIVYCEIVKNQKALFIIVNGDDAYKYTLKEVDLDYYE